MSTNGRFLKYWLVETQVLKKQNNNHKEMSRSDLIRNCKIKLGKYDKGKARKCYKKTKSIRNVQEMLLNIYDISTWHFFNV